MDFEGVISELKKAQKIGLITHQKSDGDAFSSVLALAHTLKSQGKEVVIFSNEPLAPGFEYLEGVEYEPREQFEEVDLLVAVDFNNPDRATVPEVVQQVLKRKIPIVLIDHHRPANLINLATASCADEKASATTEIIFDLFTSWGVIYDKLAANLLLFGIETDTHSMQNPNTTEKTYQVVSELMKRGANVKKIIENFFEKRSIPNLKLLGRVMERLHHNKQFSIVSSYITYDDVLEFGLESGDASSGIANYLDQIKEGDNIIVFTEPEPGKIKVSMRSNRSGANVAELGEFFGGGGHILAAGFKFDGDIKEILGVRSQTS